MKPSAIRYRTWRSATPVWAVSSRICMLTPFDKRYGERSELRQFLFTIILSKGPRGPFVTSPRIVDHYQPSLLRVKTEIGKWPPDLFHEPRHLSARELGASGAHDAGLSVSTSAFVTSRLHFGGVLVCIAITPVLGPRVGREFPCSIVTNPGELAHTSGHSGLMPFS